MTTNRERPLKILVIGQTPPPFGGQAVMIQFLLDGVYEHIELIHIRMNFSQELDSAGKFRLAKVLELARVISDIYLAKIRLRPDVLYYPPSGPRLLPVVRDIVILGSTRWLFRSTVFHFHASGIAAYARTMNPLLRKLFGFVFARPDLAIHISSGATRDGLSLGCKQERLIANGIPDAAGESIARTVTPGGTVKLLFVALLCEDKGVLVAIQAVMDLLRAGVDIELTCLGKWESAEFQARAAALIDPSFAARFRFPGVVIGAAKWNHYRSADIFLFPSFFHSETFPVVLLEAMCFSLPVVATRWRGIPDAVEEGSCAILCEPKDVAGCRDALAQLVSDSALRDRMGEKARERFLDKFTIEEHCRAMESALSQLKG